MLSALQSERLAPVISHRPGAIVFAVDDVKPATGLLVTEPVREGFARRVERPLHAISGEARIVARKFALHPLVDAVYSAFSDHRPLRLSVDDFALVIAQGFAHHVNQNAAELRHLLVDFDGKNKLVVRIDHALGTHDDWEMVIGVLCAMLREQVPAAAAEACRLDYTTTTPAARVAGEIAMLDAFQKFFDYIIRTVCGIPRIELLGTPDDWRRLLARVEALEQYGLEWWTRRVTPILRDCIASSEGRPDRYFWQCICKPQKAYGGAIISGWFADLFPWLGDGARRHRNPVLSMRREGWLLTENLKRGEDSRFRTGGIRPDEFPSGISEAPLEVVSAGSIAEVSLMGGFIGLLQDEDGWLSANPGWAVAEPRALQRLICRIRNEQSAEPFTGSFARYLMIPAALLEIVSTLRRVCLFEDSSLEWQVGELSIVVDNQSPPDALPFESLLFARRKDGRALCVHFEPSSLPAKDRLSHTSESWSVCAVRIAPEEGVPRQPDLPTFGLGTFSGSEFQVIDLDIIAALTFLLDHGGRLPDEIDAMHTPSEYDPSVDSRTAPVPSP